MKRLPSDVSHQIDAYLDCPRVDHLRLFGADDVASELARVKSAGTKIVVDVLEIVWTDPSVDGVVLDEVLTPIVAVGRLHLEIDRPNDILLAQQVYEYLPCIPDNLSLRVETGQIGWLTDRLRSYLSGAHTVQLYSDPTATAAPDMQGCLAWLVDHPPPRLEITVGNGPDALWPWMVRIGPVSLHVDNGGAFPPPNLNDLWADLLRNDHVQHLSMDVNYVARIPRVPEALQSPRKASIRLVLAPHQNNISEFLQTPLGILRCGATAVLKLRPVHRPRSGGGLADQLPTVWNPDALQHGRVLHAHLRAEATRLGATFRVTGLR